LHLDQKLHSHTASSVKRREPRIQRLARSYNKLCAELATLIHQGKAPRNAVPPQHIQTAGLFKLDVDDEIWQDVGLGDDVDGSIPRWLADEEVRVGIKNLLELDRCKEEEERLHIEKCALQDWAIEEWDCIQVAQKIASECCFSY
jgi:hypothetical protein